MDSSWITGPRTAMAVASLLMAMSVTAEPVEYCKWETLSAQCPQNEVIIMQSALYGRMQHSRCIERDFGYVGCQGDVIHLADVRCSGRHTCDVSIPDKVMDTASTCPGDLGRYLTAEYGCMPVITPPRDGCMGQTNYLLTAPNGTIASVVTEETGCGSTDTPWLIRASPGQTIDFTLHDFALTSALVNVSADAAKTVPYEPPHCLVYAILKERQAGKSSTICGGRSRVLDVHKSTSNEVEVRVVTSQNGRQRYFMLQYQVTGCPDIATPPGGWVKREGSEIRIGCVAGETRWKLTCQGTKWEGELGNCSGAVNAQPSKSGTMPMSQTLSIVVILAVALVIGALILFIGLICIRRRRSALSADRAYNVPAGVPGALKEDPYNTPYNGYNYNSSRHDTSGENEYEYVDDIKLAAARAASGGGGGGGVGGGGGGVAGGGSGSGGGIHHTPVVMRQAGVAPPGSEHPGLCAVHGGNHYTKYGTSDTMLLEGRDGTVFTAQPQHAVHGGKLPPLKGYVMQDGKSVGLPPQYYELDLDGNALKGPNGVNAHGAPCSDNTGNQQHDRNLSFGHYSQ